jgi:hypothetical protein
MCYATRIYLYFTSLYNVHDLYGNIKNKNSKQEKEKKKKTRKSLCINTSENKKKIASWNTSSFSCCAEKRDSVRERVSLSL